MVRRTVDIAVVIPDASPVLTLARIGRVDLLDTFAVPIKIVDQVYFEITRPENDPSGIAAAALKRMHNQIEVIETATGVGFQTLRARNPDTPSGNLGEIAVDEYATRLAHKTAPTFIPLVLFEDPDVMELRIARLKGIHVMNTTAWLLALHKAGIVPNGLELIEKINATRKTPMIPFEKQGLTNKIQSTWMRRSIKP